MRVLSFIRQRSFARYVALDLALDLADAASRLGWTVKWVDLEGELLEHANQPEAARHRAVLDRLVDIERFNPDLVFSYGLEYLEPVFQQFVPAMEERFHRLLQRPGAFFLFDFGFPFDRPVDTATVPYLVPLQSWDALVFCWDREALARVRASGVLKADYLPMAVNPNVFRPPDDPRGSGDTVPLVFVGGPTPERVRFLTPLVTRGLQIYGYDPAGWQAASALSGCYRGEVLERDRLRDIYGRALIAVNVTRAHGPSSLNMRVYEAMACGCLMVTDAKGDAARLFEPGRDLVVYDDEADLERTIDHFLDHPEERERIAAAGRARVLAEHTYEVRLRASRPILETFLEEHRAHERLQQTARRDRREAIRLGRELEDRGVIRRNRDNLRYREAELLLESEDRAGAAGALRAALDLNPAHLQARTLLQRIGHDADRHGRG